MINLKTINICLLKDHKLIEYIDSTVSYETTDAHMTLIINYKLCGQKISLQPLINIR